MTIRPSRRAPSSVRRFRAAPHRARRRYSAAASMRRRMQWRRFDFSARPASAGYAHARCTLKKLSGRCGHLAICCFDSSFLGSRCRHFRLFLRTADWPPGHRAGHAQFLDAPSNRQRRHRRPMLASAREVAAAAPAALRCRRHAEARASALYLHVE